MTANINCQGQDGLTELKSVNVSKVFEHDRHTYFMHHDGNCGWKMSEWTSGHCVFSDSLCGLEGDDDAMPMDDVKDFGIDLLNRAGPEKVNAAIEKAIKEHGQANAEAPA